MNEMDASGTAIDPEQQDLLIVGVGASAGGIQALQQFFGVMSPDSGMGYVVILHLSPDHDSKLAEVLQRVTAMPVVKVEDRTKVEANHVYVVPPNKHLTMAGGHINVTRNTEEEDRRAPIDIFFRTPGQCTGSKSTIKQYISSYTDVC